jgi:hypothetical protein
MCSQVSHNACPPMRPDHCRPFGLLLGRKRTTYINPEQKMDFNLGHRLGYPDQTTPAVNNLTIPGSLESKL